MMSLAIALATDSAASIEAVSSGLAGFSFTELTAPTVCGGVREGASNVQKFAALATSSMWATDVNSTSALVAATWLSRLVEEDTGMPPSLPVNLLA